MPRPNPSRLNDTRAIACCPDHGTNRGSLPDSGSARTFDHDAWYQTMPEKPRGAAGPDPGRRNLASAVGYLRGGIKPPGDC